jgi:carbamoyl-phosphate synthase/aspartate carbamoyltransferase/dihydroorotase
MSTLRLPGLIDPHVHLRDPGATYKEDFDSGTAAALAGGFTLVLDMPNNTPPVTNRSSLSAKQEAARARARCDYGLYLGAGSDNVETARDLAPQTAGLKMYLDQTFGPLRLDTLGLLAAHARNWPAGRPLLCHAEGRTMAAAILAAHLAGRSIHTCHVSPKEEIEVIRAAKQKGIQVTCEVAPHHLFLTERDEPAIGPGRVEVRPRVASAADRDALRSNIDVVDSLATDHAPHTLEEKDSSTPPPGFPGLETALALYLQLVYEGVLTLESLIEKTVTNPRRIFGLSEQPGTWIEVDPEAEWVVHGSELQSRARWTPFEGWKLRGKVRRVVLRGREAYRDGQVLAPPGFGRDVRITVDEENEKPQEEMNL